MPENAPEYSIADDYDPDGYIGSQADPEDEYDTYFVSKTLGTTPDMGFTPEDFRRYIEALRENRRGRIMAPFVYAVGDAVAQKNWYAALALALTLPDICADLENPTGISKKPYIRWWNTYRQPRYTDYLSGDDCYLFRCAFLHRGRSDITVQEARRVISGFRFVYRDPNGLLLPHCNRINNVLLQLRVDLFCTDICAGVERWEQKKLSEDPEIQKRAKEMLVVLPPEMWTTSLKGP
jgi:hypothetical protein